MSADYFHAGIDLGSISTGSIADGTYERIEEEGTAGDERLWWDWQKTSNATMRQSDNQAISDQSRSRLGNTIKDTPGQWVMQVFLWLVLLDFGFVSPTRQVISDLSKLFKSDTKRSHIYFGRHIRLPRSPKVEPGSTFGCYMLPLMCFTMPHNGSPHCPTNLPAFAASSDCIFCHWPRQNDANYRCKSKQTRVWLFSSQQQYQTRIQTNPDELHQRVNRSRAGVNLT